MGSASALEFASATMDIQEEHALHLSAKTATQLMGYVFPLISANVSLDGQEMIARHQCALRHVMRALETSALHLVHVLVRRELPELPVTRCLA